MSALSPAKFQELRRMGLASGDCFHVDLDVDARLTIENCHLVPADWLLAHSGLFLPQDKSTRILLHCADGRKSSAVSQSLATLGFDKVDFLEGGLESWKLQNLPCIAVESPRPVVSCIYDKDTGTCQYLVICPKSSDAAVIDSVLDFDNNQHRVSYKNADSIIGFVQALKLNVKLILETHVHADHLTASQYLKSQLGGSICIGSRIPRVQQFFADMFAVDKDMMACDGRQFDRLLQDNESFQLGQLECRALHVPGHTPDHMCYLFGDCVFAGDSIFMPDSGSARCDFPGGSAAELYKSISTVLFGLPDHFKIFVGHDYMPNNRRFLNVATVAMQKAANKHVMTSISEAEFIKMRTERDVTLNNPKLLFQSLNVNMRAGNFPEARSRLDAKVPLLSIPVTVPHWKNT